MIHTVALVGAGVGIQHLAAFASLPDRFSVAAICDVDETRARDARTAAPGARTSTDMAEILADPAIGIVDIALPPHLHHAACVAALRAGKHVICEKPLVTSLAEADDLLRVSEETGRQIFPIFQYRYGPGGAQMRAILAAGLTGDALAATLETHWDRDAAYYDNPWRGTWAGEGGGAILGHAIHIHDLLTTFLGPIASVHAELATRANPIEVEDCAALAIRMASGAVVTSSITLGASGNHSRLRIMFRNVTVESDHAPYAPAARPWNFTARAPLTPAELETALASVPAEEPGYAGLFAAIADALDGHPGREVTLEDGRSSVEFVTAVYRSARTGRPETLPLAADHPLYDGWHP